MGVLEKFIDLVKIDSPSDPASPTCPSTAMQLDVANHLERVMKEMGISNVRQQDGYVYGEIPATPGYEDKTPVGFIAHMDTAPEFNGIGVKPQVIENYDGGDVLLFVKQDSAGAGGALVEGEDVSGHGKQTSCMCVFLALSIAGFTRNKKRTPQ